MTETYNKSILVKEGYKETKLGLIPKDWTTPTISEVFDFLKTTSFSRNQLSYDDENNIFYIHYGDIHATFKKPLLDFETEANVPRLNDDVTLPNSVQYLQNGDVIIADASEDYDGVGEAIEIKNLNGKTAISGLHTFALRDIDKKTVPGFRTYIFKNPIVKKALKTIATGSKVYGISKSNTQKFKIVLPTLPEQQKIASILNTWDKAIAAQEKLIAQKQELKKGLMQQLLTGKKRFAGFSEEWEVKTMNDIVKYIGGEAFKSISQVEKGVKWLKIANVGIGSIKWDGNTTFLPSSFIEINPKYVLNEGDIVMALTRPILNNKLKIAAFNKKDGVALLNQRVAKLVSKNKNDLKFIYYLHQMPYFIYSMNAMMAGTDPPNISLKDLSKARVKTPSFDEQKMIVSIIESFDFEINCLVSVKEQIFNQQQGLMQQLLTGKKRVKL
ncbi:restriction endonuclease subunit S [Autumnicola edwardsiae]|uniref:Restriction endonuclease subunit S n=1 Tax=Autumnicola edwardsiae TaxID=3075594 RepID=A0ABU3CY03_9FLAO|nr:restriction endonuclease subunit S [Zunongwangia sp. F297]MDT0651240.1 restriction endonuclease subunit S [Zunongwangia sp. F297]